MNKENKSSFFKFCCDFVPLIVFFLIYKTSSLEEPLVEATKYLIFSTIFSVTIYYFYTKKISFVPLLSALLLGIFGSLTILLEDDIFIKMKPTIVNLIFASILLTGFFLKKPLLKYFLGEKLQLSKRAWLIMSLRWAIFFIFLSILNEIVWRNLSTDFWVKFKVFGMIPIVVIFTLTNIPFIVKEVNSYKNNSSE